MAMDMGPNGTLWQSQRGGDHGRTVSPQPHIVDGDFVLQSHEKHSFHYDRKGEQPGMSRPPHDWIILWRLPQGCR